ncbi:MAG: 3-isopropylmalate dehydratase [Deltaproteobacteria bacterium]|nr:3-isopropylmalate dehydratase [Deltaproteobacteria bacterium]
MRQRRILYLTQDPALVRRQLDGEDLAWTPDIALADNISTDEITPGWTGFFYDETLGELSYVGFRGGVIRRGDIKRGGFDVIVSGMSKGCGSSREIAPYSEKAAGVRFIIARSIEKIYGQNAQNIGLLTSTDFSLLPRLRAGDEVSRDEFLKGLDPISTEVVRAGGLFEYSKARLSGRAQTPRVETPPRPMNLVEKIIAAHAVPPVEAVKPGDAVFVRADVRFSHEYVTPMAESLFRAAFGEGARIAEPESVYAFRDHLTFLGKVMPEAKRREGLLERADNLAVVQTSFAARQGVRLYGESAHGGSEAICHNAIVEDVALPGQIVVGTDSHTCMAGVVGAFAFGIGSTDIANAWHTRDVRTRVPEVAHFVLRGRLASGVAAKDVMLHLLAMDFFKSGRGIGKVIEYAGDGYAALAFDERATLTNMAVEAGSTTGIAEADDVVVRTIAARRGVSEDEVRRRVVRADAGATYAESFDVDLATIQAMVATPGDPRNGVALESLGPAAARTRVDIAYGGSCTGGKMSDMEMYASVLRGRRVAAGVRLYIQYGSQAIRRFAEERGFAEVFRAAGAEILDPSCGACINAGPGASERQDQVTVSAQNRNFPGRSGPGQVYLASPYVVAASAVLGRLAHPRDLAGC